MKYLINTKKLPFIIILIILFQFKQGFKGMVQWISLGIGEFSLQANLFTGLRDMRSEKNLPGGEIGVAEGYGQYGEYYNHGFVNEIDTPYRYGGLTFNYKGLSLGIDSDRYIRHPIQNKWAHGPYKVFGLNLGRPQRMFKVLSGGMTPVFNYSTLGNSKFSLWGH